MNYPLDTVKSLTLIELLVSIIIVSMIVLSFYSLETFSHGQMINSERRAKVQNQLTYALEHMSKYVQQANGNISDPVNPKPIVLTASGFQVRVDFRNPQIPSDLDNGAWVSYSLVGSTLSTNCSAYGASGTCGLFISETLTDKIIGNFVADTIMPNNPTNGFYVKVDSLGNLVDIGLVGRYDTSSLPSLSNPQVEMKSKIICNNSSAN